MGTQLGLFEAPPLPVAEKPKPVDDDCADLDWCSFQVKYGRVPIVEDRRKPWTYRGWLMHYRLLAECVLDIPPRWQYWERTMLYGRLLDQPIPQIKFAAHANDRSEGYKMLDRCLNLLDSYSTAPVSYLLEWLKFGLAIGKTEASKLEEKYQERLYRTFNMEPWLREPYDYIGLWIADHKGKWNPSAFFPTPHNVVEMMVIMMFADAGDMRSKTVNDPCVGTGRFLLHASNYSLRLSGMDIDGTVLAGCLINGAMYAPWLVRPFPESFFKKGL